MTTQVPAGRCISTQSLAHKQGKAIKGDKQLSRLVDGFSIAPTAECAPIVVSIEPSYCSFPSIGWIGSCDFNHRYGASRVMSEGWHDISSKGYLELIDILLIMLSKWGRSRCDAANKEYTIKLPADFPNLPALLIQTIQGMHAKKTFATFQKNARKSGIQSHIS